MLWGTDLEELCEVANTALDMKTAVIRLLNEKFSNNDLKTRVAVLDKSFGNKINSEKIIQLLFPPQ